MTARGVRAGGGRLRRRRRGATDRALVPRQGPRGTRPRARRQASPPPAVRTRRGRRRDVAAGVEDARVEAPAVHADEHRRPWRRHLASAGFSTMRVRMPSPSTLEERERLHTLRRDVARRDQVVPIEHRQARPSERDQRRAARRRVEVVGVHREEGFVTAHASAASTASAVPRGSGCTMKSRETRRGDCRVVGPHRIVRRDRRRGRPTQAGVGQPVEDVVEERPAVDRHHRLQAGRPPPLLRDASAAPPGRPPACGCRVHGRGPARGPCGSSAGRGAAAIPPVRSEGDDHRATLTCARCRAADSSSTCRA